MKEQKHLYYLLLVVFIFIIFIAIQQSDKKLEETGGYDTFIKGIVTKECYSASKGKRYIDYTFKYLDKTYSESENIPNDECPYYQVNDTIMVRISSKYPNEFNKPLTMKQYEWIYN